MRTLVGDSRRLTRLVHLVLGVNAVLFGAAVVWVSLTLENAAFATVMGILGVYNLIGAVFPGAVVFPTAGPDADRSAFRFVHGMGVLFFGGIAAVAHLHLGWHQLALLSLLLGVYDLIGLALPGLYPAMAVVYFIN